MFLSPTGRYVREGYDKRSISQYSRLSPLSLWLHGRKYPPQIQVKKSREYSISAAVVSEWFAAAGIPPTTAVGRSSSPSSLTSSGVRDVRLQTYLFSAAAEGAVAFIFLKIMENSLPSPSFVRTFMMPEWFSTIILAMERPRPYPPVSLVREVSAR